MTKEDELVCEEGVANGVRNLMEYLSEGELKRIFSSLETKWNVQDILNKAHHTVYVPKNKKEINLANQGEIIAYEIFLYMAQDDVIDSLNEFYEFCGFSEEYKDFTMKMIIGFARLYCLAMNENINLFEKNKRKDIFKKDCYKYMN